MELRKKEVEAKRLKIEEEERKADEKVKRDKMIEMKKRSYYRKLQMDPSRKTVDHEGSTKTENGDSGINWGSGEVSNGLLQRVGKYGDISKLDYSRRKQEQEDKKKTDMKRAVKVLNHFDHFRSGRSSLVVVDGEMKSLTTSFMEEVNRYL
jgi:hypothetical protein